MCTKEWWVGSRKIVLVVRYIGSHTKPDKPIGTDKEKLENGEDEICAAKGKQAVLDVVLTAQHSILTCCISSHYGRTIAAHKKIGVLKLIKEKEVSQ